MSSSILVGFPTPILSSPRFRSAAIFSWPIRKDHSSSPSRPPVSRAFEKQLVTFLDGPLSQLGVDGSMDDQPRGPALERRAAHGPWLEPIFACASEKPVGNEDHIQRYSPSRLAAFAGWKLLCSAVGSAGGSLRRHGPLLWPEIASRSSPPIPCRESAHSGIFRRIASEWRASPYPNSRPKPIRASKQKPSPPLPSHLGNFSSDPPRLLVRLSPRSFSKPVGSTGQSSCFT